MKISSSKTYRTVLFSSYMNSVCRILLLLINVVIMKFVTWSSASIPLMVKLTIQYIAINLHVNLPLEYAVFFTALILNQEHASQRLVHSWFPYCFVHRVSVCVHTRTHTHAYACVPPTGLFNQWCDVA